MGTSIAVTLLLLVASCSINDAQEFFPEISEESILVPAGGSVTVSCSSSDALQDNSELDFLWFQVEKADLDKVEVTTCSFGGSGSGSGSSGSGSGYVATDGGSGRVPFFTNLSEAGNGSNFTVYSDVFGSGGFIICVINSTDTGDCASNFSAITVAPSVMFVMGDDSYDKEDDVNLMCMASGGPDLQYQWLFNGTNIEGETSLMLSLSNVSALKGGNYTCVVSNIAGSDSGFTIVNISPYFISQPDNLYTSNGSFVEFLCEAEAFPTPTYHWMRMSDDSIRNDLDLNSGTLKFNPVLLGDEGLYQCTAASGGLNVSSNLVYLTLAPVVTSISDDETYQSGEDVSLNCSAEGGPFIQYQWLFNDNTLDEENSTSLTLFNINVSSGGQYTCMASNIAGNDSSSTLVYIFPYFLIQPNDSVGSNGSVVELTCEAEGFPEPSYQWIKEGEDMIRNEGLDTTDSTLTFNPLQFGDEGIYFCNVSSGDSEISSQKIILHVAPEIGELTASRIYERGEDVILNCSALGGPDVSFMWLYEGSSIDDETSSSLILSNVNASVGGEYTCMVYNEAGNNSASTSVFVSPYFIAQPEDVAGSNGSVAVLECAAEAFPAPSYRWIKVADVISSDLDIFAQELMFKPLQFGDEGVYVCNVTSGGSSKLSEMVTLSVAPLITFISPGNQTYERNEDVVLSCETLGGPDISYQWLFNDEDINEENSSSLNLSSVDASNGGEYTCVASNSAGNDSSSVFIFISLYVASPLQDEVGSNGSMVSLQCGIEAFPAPDFQWVKEGEMIRDGLDFASSRELVFDPLLYGDEGNYFCNASSGGKFLQSQTATLFVAPLASVTPDSQIYGNGVDLEFNCTVLGGPSNLYQWQFNDIDIEGETSETITILNVNASHGGRYTCVVNNVAGNDSANSTVFISPYFTRALAEVKTTNGSSVALTCGADAFPSPSYEWSKVDEVIRDSIFDRTQPTILTFDPVLFGDEGVYNCSVFSESGAIWSSTILTVSPEGSVMAMPSSIDAEIGDMVNFTCEASGGPGNVFTWTNIQQEVVGISSNVTIVVGNVSEAGVYACNVSNAAGYEVVEVTINVSPEIVSPPMNLTVSTEQEVVFSCRASGFPVPSIDWLYEGNLIQRMNVEIFSMDGEVNENVSMLIIRKANVSDSGVYTCVASVDDENMVSSDATIIVQG